MTPSIIPITQTSNIRLRITKINVYQINLPLKEKGYKFSGCKSVEVLDSTIIEIETNLKEIKGYGECCPLGPTYLPSYAEGCRTGISVI